MSGNNTAQDQFSQHHEQGGDGILPLLLMAGLAGGLGGRPLGGLPGSGAEASRQSPKVAQLERGGASGARAAGPAPGGVEQSVVVQDSHIPGGLTGSISNAEYIKGHELVTYETPGFRVIEPISSAFVSLQLNDDGTINIAHVLESRGKSRFRSGFEAVFDRLRGRSLSGPATMGRLASTHCSSSPDYSAQGTARVGKERLQTTSTTGRRGAGTVIKSEDRRIREEYLIF